MAHGNTSENNQGGESPSAPCPIVGVGASVGGLEAFRKLLAAMPPKNGMAFVLVQHLAPEHKSQLLELLASHTAMPVRVVADGTAVEPKRAVEGGRLRLREPASIGEQHTPIDIFLRSLAEDQGENAIGVVLSGSGSDGTLGIQSVKERGGLTLAEGPAAFDSMPRNAAATGLVDYVLPVGEMPSRLLDHARYLSKADRAREDLYKETLSQLGKVCAILRTRVGHDFSQYKETTLIRRVQRRMQVVQTEDVAAYIERLRTDRDEPERLLRELLIGVTYFFRDPEAFEALERRVVPKLLEDKGADDCVRVWVPGCATGEEAFSIAILLREAMDALAIAPKVQIFATDIDDESIATARIGFFPPNIVRDVSPERLDRFFAKEPNGYSLNKAIRDTCIFSCHNLVRDPPFSKLDLISCRNLLIYLNAEIQKRLIPIFHYALKPNGCLFLGSSENASQHPTLFAPIDKKHRLFVRCEVFSRPMVEFPVATAEGGQPPQPPGVPRSYLGEAADRRAIADVAQGMILDGYAPAHVLINDRYEAVYFSARIGKYLEFPVGLPNTNILNMARRGLRMDLRAAVHKAVKSRQRVVHESIAVAVNSGTQTIDLIVEPCTAGKAKGKLFLIVFNDIGPMRREDRAGAEDRPHEASKATVQQLESELRTMSERLHTTVEELETSNEELKSSNEELVSMNEELQSSNEELETSKEELQSVNEELITVNAQLSAKVEELDRANSDLKNLLESTRIGTIFLDNNLRIRSYTAGATALFCFIQTDQGRPITDIAARLSQDGLEHDVRTVLKTLSPIEKEVHLVENSATYIMCVLPYRTLDNVIDGVVITFFDVTTLKRTEQENIRLAQSLQERLTELEILLDIVPVGVAIADEPECRRMRLNRLAVEMFQSGRETVSANHPGARCRFVRDGAEVPIKDLPLERAIRTGAPVDGFEARMVRDDGNEIDIVAAARPLMDDRSQARGAIAAYVDITERKRAERHQRLLLRELQHRVKNTLATVSAIIDETRRTITSFPDFVAAVDGRLRALGHAHELLARANWEGADLAGLVRAQVAPYSDGQQVSIAGPDLLLTAAAAVPLSIGLHELATNAVKHGALSVPQGRVDVNWWTTDETPDRSVLTIRWAESGGPAIQAPLGRGFGRQMIEQSLAYELGATTRMEFPPTVLSARSAFQRRRLWRRLVESPIHDDVRSRAQARAQETP